MSRSHSADGEGPRRPHPAEAGAACELPEAGRRPHPGSDIDAGGAKKAPNILVVPRIVEALDMDGGDVIAWRNREAREAVPVDNSAGMSRESPSGEAVRSCTQSGKWSLIS